MTLFYLNLVFNSNILYMNFILLNFCLGSDISGIIWNYYNDNDFLIHKLKFSKTLDTINVCGNIVNRSYYSDLCFYKNILYYSSNFSKRFSYCYRNCPRDILYSDFHDLVYNDFCNPYE